MTKIVYLDDDKVQHLLMKKMLRIQVPDCSAEYFTAPENLEIWLQENETKLVLSDVNFEGSSVWDWMEKFTENSNAKVILLTAHASPEDLKKSEEFPSIKAIWEKPISEENWKQIQEIVG